jgi:hypothetical protein
MGLPGFSRLCFFCEAQSVNSKADNKIKTTEIRLSITALFMVAS